MRRTPALLLALAAAALPTARGRAGESLPPLPPGRTPRDVESLWRGYDPAAEPIEARIVRQRRLGPVVCRYVLYTIGTFKGRKAVMAGYYAFPVDRPGRLPALLHLHGGGQRANLTEVVFAAKNGYASLSINWGARPMEDARPSEPNTDWGAVDATQTGHNSHYASCRPDGKTLDPVESPRNNNWFLLVLAARRAVTFLQQQPEVDPGRIGVHGHSMGGKLTVCLAGADRRIRAAVPSCGGAGSPPPALARRPGCGLRAREGLFLRTLDDTAYIPRITCPLLYLGPTNDFNAPLDCVFANFPRLAAGEVRYAVSPHLNHRHEPPFAVTKYLWFDRHLRGGPALPETPALAVRLDTPDGIPRATVRPDRPEDVARVEVFYASDPHVLTRFWHRADARRDGPAWTAPCPAPSTDRHLFVLANVYYPLRRSFTAHGWLNFDGLKEFALTAPMATINPAALRAAGIRPVPAAGAILDDFSRPWADWYRLNWANPVHWLAGTRKVKDPAFRPPAGARLALDVVSPVANTLIIQAAFNDWSAFPGRPAGTFAAIKRLPGSPHLQTVIVALSDLVPSGRRPPRKPFRPDSWQTLTELQLTGRATLWENGTPRVVEHRWRGPRDFRNLRWLTDR